MGFYINPPNDDKIGWLKDNGAILVIRPVIGETSAPPYDPLCPDHHWTVLVDNGDFLALGVAYNREEFDRFAYPGDPRPRAFCMVPNAAIIAACPEVASLLG